MAPSGGFGVSGGSGGGEEVGGDVDAFVEWQRVVRATAVSEARWVKEGWKER